MSCIEQITKSIISNCTTQGSGGNETKAWLINRRDIATITYDVTTPSMVTGMTLASGGKQAFTLTAVKKMIDSGHDLVTAQNRANAYTHFVGFHGFEYDAASVENFDAMGDIVAIVESRDKTSDGDGVFRIYGLTKGLVKITDNTRANTEYGARVIELQTEDGSTESHSVNVFFSTDYATTLAALVALETPTA